VAIEAAGAELLLVPTGARVPAPRHLVSRALSRYGALHGVFDLVGVVDGGSSPRTRARSLGALHAALAGTPVEFVQVHLAAYAGASAAEAWEGAAARGVAESMVRSYAAGGGAEWGSVHWDLPWTAAARSAPAADWSGAVARVVAAGAGERLVVSLRRPDAAIAGAATAAEADARLTQAPTAAAAPSGHDRPALSTPFVAPADETEEAVAAVWRELLGLGEVGARDDFFELGGDSLLATQVVARLRDRLGVQVPLSAVLEQPTVADLATACRRAREASREDVEMAQLLREAAGLSTEELERMLGRRHPTSAATGDRE
jgi:acyl carrier protein